MKTCFREDNCLTYKELLVEHCAQHGVEIWAYCLMTNHAHLIAVSPSGRANGKPLLI